MIEKYFIKIHSLLIALYAFSTVANYSDLNNSLFFYPRYILSQPWVMFSPDPPSNSIALLYRCRATMKFQKQEIYQNFWDKQNGSGRRKAQLIKVIQLAAIKSEKIKNKTNKTNDLILLSRAEELIRSELKHLCPDSSIEDIEIHYEQVNFLSRK